MRNVVYLGCPSTERGETEKALAVADVGVVFADNAACALSELERRDLAVLFDLSRGAAALQTARDIRSARASTLLFAVVDRRRPDLTMEAILAGVADVFARPLGGRRVANAIERERAYGARKHNGHAIPDPFLEDLYVHSPAMRDVTTLVARAGGMRAGVIVRGEEGTGRQVVARAIHAHHCAPGATFVAVDCAAHDAEELERVLFGAAERARADGHDKAPVDRGRTASRHVHDATRDLERVSRGSRLHAALNGTLYIRNVAEASTRLQGRLARVLRDREAVLAETGELISLDVRPVAGVDGTIERALQEGRVRDDLYRRLSVIAIDMPPLRHRREDVPALANCFVRQICASLGVPPKTLSRSALSLLAALPWRGNADELRGLLEQVIGGLEGGRAIALDDLLGHVRLDGGAVVFANAGTLKQARARFEREYITNALEHHQGRISEAAKALGIQRTNLYRKMRTLRVPRRRR